MTGINGFIGKRLAEHLVKHGVKIKALVRNKQLKSLDPNIEYIYGDLLHKGTLPPLLNNCDIFINCAAEIKNQELMFDINVESTRKLLNLARKHFICYGTKIHWIQLSSVGAYGMGNEGDNSIRRITESSPHSPDNMYERTKTLADELIMEAGLSSYITYTLLRPSAVFGTSMPNNSLRQLIKVVKSKYFFYIGDGNGILNYIHVDDVCNAIIKCLFNEAAKNQIFNLSNDCSQQDLITSIARLSGIRSPSLHINRTILLLATKIIEPFLRLPLTRSRIRSLTSKNFYSTDKIEKILNFKPEYKLTDRISDLF
ncbi:NAD-dependent epimerase/dehydratase family protein [Polynucleobacter corsicus]|uniref:NAD-dependent epimerase/dehydratase family protein n=1 Tax=Polynucleobacter corsicus TaxID=2081042 RepID=UPI001BFE6C15|nr:NAD-dependent epimerase/dehydratase family protein [Polynucleobacter corsicus]QWE18973.1 NAD-dependent epimerase/dehydratase family protein [Polynucleobacter corsicus]